MHSALRSILTAMHSKAAVPVLKLIVLLCHKLSLLPVKHFLSSLHVQILFSEEFHCKHGKGWEQDLLLHI